MSSRSREDYLEAIHWLLQTKGYAKTKDIAAELNVKPPSVTQMLAKLKKEGLVRHEKYSGAALTREGMKIAARIRDQHEMFRRFLEFISVPGSTADKDACVMEHSLSKRTMGQMRKFVSFIDCEGEEFANRFREYSEKKR